VLVVLAFSQRLQLVPGSLLPPRLSFFDDVMLKRLDFAGSKNLA
jgi:hypothetical protein